MVLQILFYEKAKIIKSIGASEEQLLKFYQKNSSHLSRQLPIDIIIDSTNWKLFLGNHIHNSSYRDYFLNEIKNYNILKCLNTYLPILMRGASGGAFHPLIRFAYAVEINSDWEARFLVYGLSRIREY